MRLRPAGAFTAGRLLLPTACVAALVLLGIWAPEFRHYWIATPSLSPGTLVASRTIPGETTFGTLSKIEFVPAEAARDDGLKLAVAESILRGHWVDSAQGTRQITLPFSASDLEAGTGGQQLRFASLAHVDQLLDAYEVTDDPRFLAASRDIINAWASFESKALWPRGFLWNDHAVAERVLVLTRYWGYFRNAPIFDEKSGALLLGFIGRSGRLLADPQHFTVRTNHGVMQNLALLHVAAGFPALQEAAMFRDIAVERLSLQLRFYQSREGVVLEHSAGYHRLGLALLEALDIYRSVLALQLPFDLEKRRVLACDFLAELTRPDGSLPLIGNTSVESVHTSCRRSAARPTSGAGVPGSTFTLKAVSGYAVTWYAGAGGGPADERKSQVVVHWGNFKTRAHKHDDEMSISTWFDGHPVISGAGYWPYEHNLQKAALSWRGSNAPHFAWERSSDDRQTDLLAAGHEDGITATDLVRSTSRKATIRRQIVTLAPTEWLTVDYADSDGPEDLVSVWTLYPGWGVSRSAANGAFDLRQARSTRGGNFDILSTGELAVRELRASAAPFGGWVALAPKGEAIMPASSIEAVGHAGQPIVTLWRARVSGVRPVPTIGNWTSASDWTICLDGESCTSQVRRSGFQIDVTTPGEVRRVLMQEAPSQREVRDRLNERYGAAAEVYPAWRDLRPWRSRVSWLVMASLVAQTLIVLIASRRDSVGGLQAALQSATLGFMLLFAWIAAGYWVVFVYFSASWAHW